MLICLCVVHGCFVLQWQSCVVVTNTTWPAKPKLFTVWSFTEKGLPTPKNFLNLVFKVVWNLVSLPFHISPFALTSHMYPVNSCNVWFLSHLSCLLTILPVHSIHCSRFNCKFSFCKNSFSYDFILLIFPYFELTPLEVFSLYHIFRHSCIFCFVL